MNRDFLSNFERPKPKREEPPAEAEASTLPDEAEYTESEYPLNVCYVWPEGNQAFSEYSRLAGGKINADYTCIQLNFGGEIVELTGIALLPLFESLMGHRRKFIYCDDARYNDLVEDAPVVNEINITQA